jgi:Tfp pilus assembly protein PilF
MAPGRFFALRVTSLATVIVLAAGCQGLVTPSGHTPIAPAAPAEPVAALTKAQRADLKVALARSLEKSGDTERAVAVYGEALEADPKRVDAYLRLAALYEMQGRAKESRDCYRKAQAIQPANADVYCSLGYSLYLQGDWAEARKQLEHALQLNPENARAHNNLGLVLARSGQTDEAAAEFKKAGCSATDAQINLAYCYLLDGKCDSSRQHLATALRLEPDSVPAKKAMQDLNDYLARQQLPQGSATASIAPAAGAAMPPRDSQESPTNVTWRQSR